MKNRTYLVATILLAFAGLLDSAYLAEKALQGQSLVCDIAGLNGCNVVAQSVYSKFLGIPLALYGVVFYVLFFAALFLYTKTKQALMRTALYVLVLAGALLSTYFLYLQVYVIQALCIYCIGSAIVAYLLAILVFSGTEKPVESLPVEEKI